MNVVLASYGSLVAGLRTALFWIAAAVAIVAIVDFLVRTRRISPFSPISRYFRARIDPLMAPIERLVVRAGGRPANAPWWALVAVIVGGLLLIAAFDLVGGLLVEVTSAVERPALIPAVAVSWAFSLVELALLIRVISTWFNISPWSPWIRWTYVLTEWLLAPLRRFIPPFGMVDITPLVGYFILWLLKPIVVGLLTRIAGPSP